VIGPNPIILDKRQKKYEKAISEDLSFDRVVNDMNTSLEILCHNKKKAPSAAKENELANMASIAFFGSASCHRRHQHIAFTAQPRWHQDTLPWHPLPIYAHSC
jgi:hypothetical protein